MTPLAPCSRSSWSLVLATLLPLAFLLPLPASAAPTRDEVAAALNKGEARGQDFSGAQASGLTAGRCDLSGTTWLRADLRGASLSELDLSRAKLAGASLRGALLDRVSLIDADLSGCDLSGALLKLVNLDGANLADCDFTGARLDQVLFTSSGGTHLPGLRLALQQATGQEFSRPWVAALSGDAFAFVYNTENPGFWPNAPFTVSPLLAAPAILGLSAKMRSEYAAEQLLLDEKETAKGVQLLPVRLMDDPGLLQGRPLWAVLTGRETADRRTYFALNVPPFGPQTYRSQELLNVWAGPWDNLEAVGGSLMLHKLLLTITPKTKVPPRVEQAKAALRQAAQIITDRRTYGPLVPGEAGLTRLAADLRAAAQGNDLEAVRRLAVWEGFPRQCLLGSRLGACEFLTEAAAELTGEPKAAAQDALIAYRGALAALGSKWPGLGVAGDAVTPEVRERYNRAADLVAGVAAAEHKAAGSFGKL